MRRKTFLIALFLAVASTTGASRASAIVAKNAPPSHILRSTWVKGATETRAIIYRAKDTRLGILMSTGSGPTLVWSTTLPGTPVRLSSPGPAGLVQGVIRGPSGSRAVIFAYAVRNGKVTSAIAGQPSGQVSGVEGARFHGLSFTLSAPDRAHVGSVLYRFDTRYAWKTSSYALATRVRVPDYSSVGYPKPNATYTAKSGNITLIRLEIASTEAQQETGLMNRTALDPDSGMIFVWPTPVLESFYMENTYIPLSIAFLSPTGTVQEIQDMDPLTLTLHTPQLPYQFAIEANLGFFKNAGITPGDTLDLHLTP